MVVIERPNGARIAIFPRKHRDSFRNGKKSITEARKLGEETWPLDAHLLRKSKSFNPTHVIIFLTDLDDFWLSKFDDWFDIHKRITRYASHTGNEILHLPSKYMRQVASYSHLRSL